MKGLYAAQQRITNGNVYNNTKHTDKLTKVSWDYHFPERESTDAISARVAKRTKQQARPRAKSFEARTAIVAVTEALS